METYREFKRLGIPCHYTVFDEDLTKYDLVVFGRRAFDYEFATVPNGLDLGALVKSGKKLLILEQSEKTLRERFSFRTEYLSPREVFARGNFPVDDALLRYWRGAATLTTGYEVAAANPTPANYIAKGAHDGGEWQYEWNDGEIHPRPIKWGNTHNVATVTIIKPDTGNFRTLADAGFALNYAAALEYVEGSGRIVFSQFDLIGRTAADPAAELVLKRLVAHAAKPAALCGVHGAKVVEADLESEVFVREMTKASAFVKAGGTLFVKHQGAAALGAKGLPVALEVTADRVRNTVIGKPADPLFAGLGNADFFWKGAFDVTLANGRLVASVPYGKGRYVFCQLDPRQFGDIEKDHWLRDSKWNMERTIRTLMTNCGVEMPPPRFLSVPKSSLVSLGTLELAGEWEAALTRRDYEAVRADRARTLPGSAKFAKATLPGLPAAFAAAPAAGEGWIRRTFELPADFPADGSAELYIGSVSGESVAFVNGHEVGITDTETDVNTVANIARRYEIPASVLKRGANTLVLRVAWFRGAQLGLAGSMGAVTGPIELRLREPRHVAKMPEAIDLRDCEWWGHPFTDEKDTFHGEKRQRFTFPGKIQAQHKEFAGASRFWFLHWFEVPEKLPEGAKPMLIVGSIDDEDITYVNGVEIGRTDHETCPKDYWRARRAYPIDPKLLKVGRNEIRIRYRDLRPDGEITGPIKVVFEDEALTAARKLAERPYAHDVNRDDDPYWHHGF